MSNIRLYGFFPISAYSRKNFKNECIYNIKKDEKVSFTIGFKRYIDNSIFMVKFPPKGL